MNKADKKVKDYLERACRLYGNIENMEELTRMFGLSVITRVIEIAKMIQREETK